MQLQHLSFAPKAVAVSIHSSYAVLSPAYVWPYLAFIITDMLQLTRSTAVILMTHACEEGCALVAPALTNKWLMCTHVCLHTHNTYKLGCHSVGSNCSGWWVFLSPPVWLSIYISLQDHPIHPSLTSRLSVFHFVTFASQPACSQSCMQVLLKLKRWMCVHMCLGLVVCVGGKMKIVRRG